MTPGPSGVNAFDVMIMQCIYHMGELALQLSYF